MSPKLDHHDDWEHGYWQGQPEPKPGTRAHLEKYGGHFIGALVVIAAFIGLGFAIAHSLSLPVVYESYSTGQCVRVIDPAGVYSCENMPTKFHHEWTK